MSIESIPTIEPWPLAARIHGMLGAGQNQWVLVVANSGEEMETCDALLVELESLYGGTVRRAAAHSLEDWQRAVASDRDDVLLISHESRWDPNDWRKLDKQRSRLMRRGMTILVVDQESAKVMVVAAPNLWSWIGGMVWTLQLDEGEDE
jgi:hypothetical protein